MSNTFEESLKELERISSALSSEKLTLDQCVSLYQKGKELTKKCREFLSKSKLVVEYIDKEDKNSS